MSHPHYTHINPRDYLIPAEEVNATPHYVVYSVFRTTGPLCNPDTATVEEVAPDIEMGIRGWCDTGSSRADVGPTLWTLVNDPYSLQVVYHTLCGSESGRDLESVWSHIGVHRFTELNCGHAPACFSGVAPHPWVCVYPSMCSYEWYYMDEERRSKMLTAHGRVGREYPGMPGSTVSVFILNGYEWLLALEVDKPHRFTNAIRHQHGAKARLHMRKEVPFFAGPRTTLEEWAYHQPHS